MRKVVGYEYARIVNMYFKMVEKFLGASPGNFPERGRTLASKNKLVFAPQIKNGNFMQTFDLYDKIRVFSIF